VWDSAAFSSIFLASSFSCSRTESTPAHTQVTQAVSVPLREKPLGLFQKYVSVKSSSSLQNQVSGFSKFSGLFKPSLLAVASSKFYWLENWLIFFVQKVSLQICSGF